MGNKNGLSNKDQSDIGSVKQKGLTNGSVKEKLEKEQLLITMGKNDFVDSHVAHNGFTNGMGKGGFTNGNSQQGLVNGSGRGGFTNGVSSSDHEFGHKPIKLNDRKSNRSTQLFLTIVIVIMLLSTVLYYGQTQSDNPITINIDNDYREWTNLTNIGYADFGIIEKKNTLYLTLEKDNILKGKGNITESYLIFIDVLDLNNGYHIGYGSYEYYIDIYGYNNSIEKSTGYQFDERKHQSDWNGFSSRYSPFNVRSANNINQIELSLYPVQLGISNLSKLNMLVYHFDTTGDYEYSQIIDVNNIKVHSHSEEGTRSNMKLSYYHLFEQNELHINMEESLAYSSVPYEIRVITKTTTTNTTTPTEDLQPNQQQTTNHTYIERDMKTTIIIEHDVWQDDIIEQCGGHIYNTTFTNYSFTDTEIVIYNMNHSVSGMKIVGDFGIKHIPEQNTRSGDGIITLSSIPELPSPSQTIGNNTHLTARQTHYPVTIDGAINTVSHNEWYPSEKYVVDLTRDMDIAVQIFPCINSLYIYIISNSETSSEVGDYAEVYFDTDNDGTSLPDSDDIKIRVYQNDTVAYFEGDGSGWVQTTVPDNITGANYYTGNPIRDQQYEFNITLDIINKNNQWEAHDDAIGFGGHVHLQGETDNIWYPSQYSSTDPPATQYDAIPSGWGNIIYQNWTQDITQYDSITPPTVDGVLDEAIWTTYADYHTFTKTQTMSFYFVANETYFWYGGMLDNDVTLDTGDFCQLFFNIGNEWNLYPDSNDIGFSLTGANTTTYYIGTGAGWVSVAMPTGWIGYTSYTNGVVTYEIQGLMSNLSASGWDQSGETIMFMNMITDNGGGYTMQYPDYYGGTHDMRYDPECWVHLVLMIPEYDNIMPITLIMLMIGIVFVKKRKDEDDRAIFGGEDG